MLLEKSSEDDQHIELKTQAARQKAIGNPSTKSVQDNNNQIGDNVKPTKQDTQGTKSNPEIREVPDGRN